LPERLGARPGRERRGATVRRGARAAVIPSIRARVSRRAGAGIAPQVSPGIVPRMASRIAPGFAPGFAARVDARIAPRVAPRFAPRIATQIAPRIAARVAARRAGPLTRWLRRRRDRHPTRGGGASNRGTPRVAGLCTGSQGRPVGRPLRRTGRRGGVAGRLVLRGGGRGISGVGGSHLGIGSRSARCGRALQGASGNDLTDRADAGHRLRGHCPPFGGRPCALSRRLLESAPLQIPGPHHGALLPR
jgi:hypothetical protein